MQEIHERPHEVHVGAPVQESYFVDVLRHGLIDRVVRGQLLGNVSAAGAYGHGLPICFHTEVLFRWARLMRGTDDRKLEVIHPLAGNLEVHLPNGFRHVNPIDGALLLDTPLGLPGIALKLLFFLLYINSTLIKQLVAFIYFPFFSRISLITHSCFLR